MTLPERPNTLDAVIGNPLGVKGAAAEAAITRLSLECLPVLEFLERAATPLRRAVPYRAGCWKLVDPQTLLWTGFGLEDGGTGTLAAARWRFIENELFVPDYGKDCDLAGRRLPVSTLHRETHGEPNRSARYRLMHRTLGLGAELRAAFRTGDTCWGITALLRGENEPDFSDQEVTFIARVSAHVGHGLRDALLREQASAGTPERAPGVIVLGRDGAVRSLTDQARFWLEQFPHDREAGLELPAAVHAVARRALGAGGPGPIGPSSARVRLISGRWLSIQAAILRGDHPGDDSVAVTLAPASAAELEPLRLALYELTPREREVAKLLVRGRTNDDIARALWISRYTVKDHVKAVYAKLHVTSRAELSAKLFHEHIAPQLGSQQVREFGRAEPAG
ncbi:MAG: helix-turn-helix transcriptional regulator [Actinobacteria bacterium]|nr:helix-turn-helix transcriptional regulator [Actinomycetota bacterium]